jgi:uncharacterized protein (DUF58 family)
MSVRLSDPFGLVRLDRAFQSTSALIVTPRVVALPTIPLSGAWTGSGDNRPRAFATGSPEDVTVREYRRGDDLRRVHWRSSARVGELMVRREEQPWQSRATVFIDNRVVAHRGVGVASSLEHAVVVAASIGVHLVQRGFRVRLVTALGDETGGSWHDRGGPTDTAPLLESLAVLAAAERTRLDTRWIQDAGHSGLLIAVLGSLAEADTAAVTQMHHSAATAMAVTLDVDAWRRGVVAELSSDAAQARAAWLQARGWKAVGVGPLDVIPSAWQELGRSGRASAVTASAVTGPVPNVDEGTS